MANNDYDMEIEELLHKKAEIERKLAGEDDSSDDDRYSDVSSDSEEPTAKRSCPFRGNGRDSEGFPAKDRMTMDDNKDSDNEDDDKESTCSFVSSPSRSRCSSAVLANHATNDDDERSDVDEDNSKSSPSSSKKENVADFDVKLAQKLTKKLANGVAIETNPKGEHPSSAMEQDDLEALLEKPVDDVLKANNQNKVWKTVLEKMENDHFGTLPDGWTRITHKSGMPLYLHRESSVVTAARPYLVSVPTARYHNVPLSAIPCLHQRRIDEKAREQAAQKEKEQEPKPADEKVEKTSNALASLRPKDITIERQEDYELTADEFNDYAKKIWKFKKILVTTNVSQEDRRNKRYEKKLDLSLKSAGVPHSAKEVMQNKAPGISLINIPTTDTRFNKRSFLLNPHGKTSITILHEYIQRALRGHIVYDTEETKNVQAPYRCLAQVIMKKATRLQMAPSIKEKLVVLQEKCVGTKEVLPDEDCIVLGRGTGTSKRNAKMIAAKQALEILLPELHFNDSNEASIRVADEENKQLSDYSIRLFDLIPIDDVRVNDECTKRGQTRPFAILKEAVTRSIKWQGLKPIFNVVVVGQQKTECTITLGDMKATVVSCGAKNGKHRAAQALLKQMHPELETYGALLRLYADSAERKGKLTAKKHHEEVVRMQKSGSELQPNVCLINKLREEMYEQEIGTPTYIYSQPQSGPLSTTSTPPLTADTATTSSSL